MQARLLAVVPARGGSKGILRKNLSQVGGLPLVVWALRTAMESNYVDAVVLSTDDEEISSLGQAEGAIVIHRPAELSTDTASSLSVLQHTLFELSKKYKKIEGIVLLEPTSPFRPAGLIDLCAEKFLSSETKTVATVVALERNPRYIFSTTGDQASFYIQAPKVSFYQRQEFEHLKRVNGCVYIYEADSVKNGKSIVEPIKVVEMTQEMSVNIDNPLDLELANIVFEKLNVPDGPFTYITGNKK